MLRIVNMFIIIFMKRVVIALAAAIIICSCGPSSKMSKADKAWSYEIQSAGVGVEGTYVLNVWSYSRKPEIPVELAKKNAIHATIFRGVPAGNGAAAQPPLVAGSQVSDTNPFFENFFISDYQKFINSVASKRTITKTGKREYKICYTISVSKDSLRKYLEKEGIIKSLSTGF